MQELIRLLVEFGVCGDCSSCSGCTSGSERKTCPGCVPEGGFKNMGVMWEIIAK